MKTKSNPKPRLLQNHRQPDMPAWCANQELYRVLFELGPVAVYACDVSGAIQSFNNRAVELWGRKPLPGDTDGRFFGAFKLFQPDGSFMPHARSPMAEVLSGKRAEVQDAEIIIERPDHLRINVIATIRPLKNQCGAITGAMNCFYDITEHKSAEKAQHRIEVLSASNEKLSLEIKQHKATVEALKKSEHHYSQLLKKSDGMQEQLRQLSRQILTAQEDERKRISRELHDVIAQTLTGINVRLATLKKEATFKTKHLDRDIARTQRLVEKSVEIVHQFARELRPAVLDDLGLIPALHSFAKNFSKNTQVHVHLKAFAEVEQLSSNLRTVLYRVAQEALTNVARHAEASRVEVNISKLPDGVWMKIHDDGKSFDMDRILRGVGRKRLGLLGMRERLEMVGGQLEVEAVRGKGTTVIAKIPSSKAGA